MTTVDVPPPKAPRLPWKIGLPAFALCLAPVFIVSGLHGGFSYWNALPIAVAFAALWIWGLSPVAGTFALVAVGFTELVHFVWIGDWGRTASGSSTSGLIFLFLPFWSILFGLIAALIAWCIPRFSKRPASRSSGVRRPHLE